MEREQIIKALECFHQRILNTNLAEKITEAEIIAIIDALALIKELTEENEKLLTALANYDRLTDVRIAEEYYTAEAYEELREENERLRKNLETFKGKQKSLQKQIEVLAKENHLLLSKDFDITVGECHIVFSNGKKGNIYTFTEKDQIAREMLEGEE